MVNGPLGKVLQLLTKQAGVAGKKMGRAVHKDVIEAQRSVRIDHSNNYTDLQADNNLSAEWLGKLIDRSKNPDQLKKLAEYMTNDDKTANLGSARRFLLRKLAGKVQTIHLEAETKWNTTVTELTDVIEQMADYLF